LFRRDPTTTTTTTDDSSTRATYPYSARLSTDAYRPASSAGPSTYGMNGAGETGDRPTSAAVVVVGSRLPLRNDDEAVYRRMYVRPGQEYMRHGEAPTVLERLVEPLAPSRFTAQMHIPPFRG
jgi:hypothetical protein